MLKTSQNNHYFTFIGFDGCFCGHFFMLISKNLLFFWKYFVHIHFVFAANLDISWDVFSWHTIRGERSKRGRMVCWNSIDYVQFGTKYFDLWAESIVDEKFHSAFYCERYVYVVVFLCGCLFPRKKVIFFLFRVVF